MIILKHIICITCLHHQPTESLNVILIDKLKLIIKAQDINCKYKAFLKNTNFDELFDKIHGNINLNTFTSRGDYELVDSSIPIHYEIQFVNKHKDGKTKTFTITKQDDKTKCNYEEEVEIDEDSRIRPSGPFFPFINETNIDLTDYQIFYTFDLNNYHDNCFVYACIQSYVFTNTEENEDN